MSNTENKTNNINRNSKAKDTFFEFYDICDGTLEFKLAKH